MRRVTPSRPSASRSCCTDRPLAWCDDVPLFLLSHQPNASEVVGRSLFLPSWLSGVVKPSDRQLSGRVMEGQTQPDKPLRWSGWRDLNSRRLDPQTSAAWVTRQMHTPSPPTASSYWRVGDEGDRRSTRKNSDSRRPSSQSIMLPARESVTRADPGLEKSTTCGSIQPSRSSRRPGEWCAGRH
jgi:hypothetical protein